MCCRAYSALRAHIALPVTQTVVPHGHQAGQGYAPTGFQLLLCVAHSLRWLCIDEFRPLSAKTYDAKRWSPAGQPPKVAHDYGRRANVLTFCAFEPRTGNALTVCAERRRSCDFTDFLEQVVQRWPEGEIVLILDNLSVHHLLGSLRSR
jgi:hypothetical protein